MHITKVYLKIAADQKETPTKVICVENINCKKPGRINGL